MNNLRLVFCNIRGNSVRSLIIFLCILGIAGYFISTTLIVRGFQVSLQRGIERLGADILVVPESAADRVESALLVGKPTQVWMSEDYVQKIANVRGVEKVSPQIYLHSLYDAACCSMSETFLVVFDPDTDFTVTSWLEKNLGRDLSKGEIIGGSYIFIPPGETNIRLYGVGLTLAGNLEATGTGLDQTIFFTGETAEEIARSSLSSAEKPLIYPQGQVSSILVKTEPGADPHKVCLQMMLEVPGIFPIESPNLFGAFREQMLGLLRGFLVLLMIAWIIGVLLIALIFSLAVNERRREIATMRAVGATRNYVFRILLTEAGMLALAGGGTGILLSSFLIFIFKDYLAGTLRMPFLFPSPLSLMILFLSGIALSVLTAWLAVLVPTLRLCREEPAVSMRE